MAEFMKRFREEAVQFLDLKDGVAYTSFLNGLKSGQFKFSFAEQKETTLIEALRRSAAFIRATEISAESTDASRKARIPVDRNARHGERRPRLKIIDQRFTTYPQSMLIEVKKHPMSKKPQLVTTSPKPHNAWMYREFHE